MKTRQEVEDLKQNWMNDAIWDLEKTEGFEEYQEELKIFRLETETAWERKERERVRQKAMMWGCSVDLVREFERLAKSIGYLMERLDHLEGS